MLGAGRVVFLRWSGRPDDLSAAGDELAAVRAANARLREANARLRQLVEAKETEIARLAQFDAQLAGVQQCCQHLSRHLKGVHALHPDWQHWAEEVRQIRGDAHRAVRQAAAAGQDALDPGLLAELRDRYHQAVHWGGITNRLRDWDDGKNHPGYVLARRLKTKAEQVWLFTRNFAVPWTNNASEQAIKGPKRHQAVSGYWHSLATLARYCRARSYLATSRNHGIRPIDAIHAAPTGKPWLPAPVTA